MNKPMTSRAIITLFAISAQFANASPNFGTIATPQSGHTLEYPAAAYYGSDLHLFASDRNISAGTSELRWCRPPYSGTSLACTWSTIDGGTGNLKIFGEIKTYSWSGDGKLHVFYVNQFGSTQLLRHGWFDGTSWQFENLDGAGGANGRISALIGGGGTIGAAGFTSGGTNWLFVSYFDATNGNLRLGWRPSTSNTWSFQDQDGHDSLSGHLNGVMGGYSTLVATATHLHIFYSDSTNFDLRHSWWGGGSSWSFATRDGNGSFTNNSVVSAIGAVYLSGVLHIFYTDQVTADIIHAWDGSAWSFLAHDTPGTLAHNGSACADGTYLRLTYSLSSSGDLRLSSSAGGTAAWSKGTIDGQVNDSLSGTIDANVGLYSACAANSAYFWILYTYDVAGVKSLRFAYIGPPS